MWPLTTRRFDDVVCCEPRDGLASWCSVRVLMVSDEKQEEEADDEGEEATEKGTIDGRAFAVLLLLFPLRRPSRGPRMHSGSGRLKACSPRLLQTSSS